MTLWINMFREKMIFCKGLVTGFGDCDKGGTTSGARMFVPIR